jgi:hypothetical protein
MGSMTIFSYYFLPITLVEISKMWPFHLWLHATCSCLQLSLGVFATIRSNFNYFDHFYNYVSIIENFIRLVEYFFNLFSSMNRFICLINCINNQVSRTLKLLYDDLRAYLNGCIKVIFMIYYLYHKYIVVCILINMYVYCSYIESEYCYFNSEFFKFQPKKFIWFEIWNLSFELLFLNLKFNISRQKILIESKNGHFNFEYYYLILKTDNKKYDKWDSKKNNNDKINSLSLPLITIII